MKAGALLALLVVFGSVLSMGCVDTGTEPSGGPSGETCGNGMCVSGETCETCPADCGACPVTGKETLISFAQEKWDACHYKSDCEGHGTTITFDVGDAITNIELARILDLDPQKVGFKCGSIQTSGLEPPAELGCNYTMDESGKYISNEINPTATVKTYVRIKCEDDYLDCILEFQKA